MLNFFWFVPLSSRSTGDRRHVNGPGDVLPFTNEIPFHWWLSFSCPLFHPKAVQSHMGEPLGCHAGFCNTQTVDFPCLTKVFSLTLSPASSVQTSQTL